MVIRPTRRRRDGLTMGKPKRERVLKENEAKARQDEHG